MPGVTDNADLLAAGNQIIVVLNEINAQLPLVVDKCCSCSYSSHLDPLPADSTIEGTPHPTPLSDDAPDRVQRQHLTGAAWQPRREGLLFGLAWL